jgi:small conductance mechanosensitive channel
MSYYIIMFILVLTIAGIPSTYFAGMLIGLGTAIGFGLKDEFKAISNGIIILIARPFRIGDTIQVNGYKGTVVDIQLFQTVLRTADNLNVIFNNGLITSNGIVNFSDNSTIRQDIIISVSYDDDISKVKSALENVAKQSKFILREPEPMVTVSEYSESSTAFLIRIWVNHLDAENAKFSINEQIKAAFDNAQISIPYPKHDITIKRTANPFAR